MRLYYYSRTEEKLSIVATTTPTLLLIEEANFPLELGRPESVWTLWYTAVNSNPWFHDHWGTRVHLVLASILFTKYYDLLSYYEKWIDFMVRQLFETDLELILPYCDSNDLTKRAAISKSLLYIYYLLSLNRSFTTHLEAITVQYFVDRTERFVITLL